MRRAMEKVSAIAARMLQFKLTHIELEDAIEGKEMEHVRYDGDCVGVNPDDADRAKICKEALSKFSKMSRAQATYRKDGTGLQATGKITWTSSAAAPVFKTTSLGVHVMCQAAEAPVENSMPWQSPAIIAAPRAPLFSATEHVRLFHALLDDRMTNARRLLSRPRNRDDLDREPVCPWDTYISPLFNDHNFKPSANTVLCDGITF
jgi:hypothetical protein